MLNLIFCDYSDECILFQGTITSTGGPADATPAIKRTSKRLKKEYLKIVHHLLTA